MAKRFMLAIAALGFLSGFLAAQSERGVTVKIPFQFVAGEATLPPGDYRIERDVANPTVLRVLGPDGKNSGVVLFVVTRLAPVGRSGYSSCVFDKIGSKRYLSEVWMSGQDGFLVKSTKEKHEHAVIDSNQ